MLSPLGAMQVAIDEARRGLGFVAPNPPVGAVLIDREGQFLAKGYHARYGGDHAEIAALKNLQKETSRYRQGAVLEGATLYVTLEPCAHEGKTPSCAKKLAQLPIRRVVYGLRDPNPLVSGRGLQILRDAGKEVMTVGEASPLSAETESKLTYELEKIAEVFLYNHREKKTFVGLKVATTLDGCLAHITGESQWLTGERAREHVHYLRAQYDAVLVGKETFLRDDPKLNIRHPLFVEKLNRVVILDSNGACADEQIAKSNLAKVRPLENIIVAQLKAANSQKSAAATSAPLSSSSHRAQRISCASNTDGLVRLDDLLAQLYQAGVYSILVEGGARVASSFLQYGNVQRLYQFIAPQILGAQTGISFTQNLKLPKFAERIYLRQPEAQIFGEDVMITGIF